MGWSCYTSELNEKAKNDFNLAGEEVKKITRKEFYTFKMFYLGKSYQVLLSTLLESFDINLFLNKEWSKEDVNMIYQELWSDTCWKWDYFRHELKTNKQFVELFSDDLKYTLNQTYVLEYFLGACNDNNLSLNFSY